MFALGLRTRSSPRAFVPLITFAVTYLLYTLGLVTSLIAFLQLAGWQPYPIYNQLPSGVFYNPISQGMFLSLVCVCLLCRRRWWLAAQMLPALYIAHNRGGLVAVAFGLLALWLRHPLWLLVIAIAGACAMLWHPSLSDMQRMEIWYAAATHLTFWGNGWGSFQTLWIGNPAWWPIYVHNDYLELVFEFGIWSVPFFGLVAWAASRTSATLWPLLIAYLTLAAHSMPMHVPLVPFIGAWALIATLLETPYA